MAQKKTAIKFKKGMVVSSGKTYVLVTGKGGTKAYKSFAGVCISSDTTMEEIGASGVGDYSDTWNREAFKPTTMHIPSIILWYISCPK